MKLQQLLSFFDRIDEYQSNSEKTDILQTEVSGIYFDARLVKPQSVFVAIKGSQADGHQFLQQAIDNGAIALIVDKDEKQKYTELFETFSGLTIPVPEPRQMLDLLAARFYDYPSHKLFCFGVTGTNGKTSITYLLEHILNSHRKTTGVMGTVNHRVRDQIWDSSMTTPDPVTLQSRLQDFVRSGAVCAALEVSSHALDQRRAESVHFNTVIFTNLTHDHLDYHKTMDDYFKAKQRLFTDLMWISLKRPQFAIINVDDVYGRKLRLAEPVIGWTYGQKDADFTFKVTKMDFNETCFELSTPLEKFEARIPLTGMHTVYNVVAAMAAALTCGISIEQSLQALQSFSGVPGRLQKVVTAGANEKTVFVDYAHTPDALSHSIQSLRYIRQQNKLSGEIITVFGCGGDRDKTKRPKMADIACRLSDHVIITSDNPRTEDPEKIIADILQGCPVDFKNKDVEVDRERAIALALRLAKPGDVVLIAGKGHEDYQIIGTTKSHFSDYEVAAKYLN